MGQPTFFWLVSIVLAIIGICVAAWALLADRSRGRRRCPRCWYDMSGHEGRRCPECGREAKSERHLFRTHRRWRIAFLGVFLLFLAAASCITAEGLSKGWDRVTPSSALILIARFSDDPWAIETLIHRTGVEFSEIDPGGRPAVVLAEAHADRRCSPLRSK